MSDFLNGSDEFWGSESNQTHFLPASTDKPKTINGRFVIYRRACPLCGSSKCKIIKTKKIDGVSCPVIYCDKNNKQVECVYAN